MSFRKAALLFAALALPACEEDINDDSTPPAVTRRVSVDAAGGEANRQSENPDLTPDGRYVVFQSAAANLVPGDSNGKIDIFRKDLITGAIVLVSVNELGQLGDGDSTNPSISADGMRVAFQSLAMNLDPDDTDADPGTDVYVKDLSTGDMVHVSQAAAGGLPSGSSVESFGPRISAGGRFVVFVSNGEDLVDDPLNFFQDNEIYRRDLQAGVTDMVSVGVSGDPAAGECLRPSVSEDGRFVAFESVADDLINGDTNGGSDIFVRDMDLETTELVSAEHASDPDGTADGSNADGNSVNALITPDGRFVVFESGAPDLVPADLNGLTDVFLRDRQTSGTALASVGLGLGGAAGQSTRGVVSPDGRFVAFLSGAPNLTVGDTNGVDDHFWRDLALGRTYRVSVRTGGAQSALDSVGRGALTADGRFAVFASNGVDLSIGDANGAADVFLRGPLY